MLLGGNFIHFKPTFSDYVLETNAVLATSNEPTYRGFRRELPAARMSSVPLKRTYKQLPVCVVEDHHDVSLLRVNTAAKYNHIVLLKLTNVSVSRRLVLITVDLRLYMNEINPPIGQKQN